MTWEEALNAIVDAIDVSAFDEQLNTLREALSRESSDDGIKAELEQVRAELRDRETSYSDLEKKYRERFKELINNSRKEIETKQEALEEEMKEDRPITFEDLSLTADTE